MNNLIYKLYVSINETISVLENLDKKYKIIIIKETSFIWFGLVSLFNGISTFVGYLMPKPFS